MPLATIVQRAGKCVVEIEAYSALCGVIDCLVATGKGLVDPDTLLNAVETFLDKFDTAFGFDWSTPKFHWLLHFSDVHNKFEKLTLRVGPWSESTQLIRSMELTLEILECMSNPSYTKLLPTIYMLFRILTPSVSAV